MAEGSAVDQGQPEPVGTRPLVVLFSSNVRPLYEQDVLNVLGAPPGSEYRFRYRDKYVSEALQARLSAEYKDDDVLVLYSLQQEAEFHPPVFIPARLGTLIDYERGDGLWFLTFKIGEYAAPSANSNDAGLAASVREFQEGFIESPGESPYRASAGLLEDGARVLSRLDKCNNPGLTFATTTEILAKTASFRAARFVTFSRISDEKSETVIIKDGKFELEGGKNYIMRLRHNQPVPVAGPIGYTIACDADLVQVIGSPTLVLASQYDAEEVHLHIRHPGADGKRQTVVIVEPSDPQVQGPRIVLEVTVVPARSIAAASGAALLFTLPAMAGAVPPSFPEALLIRTALVILVFVIVLSIFFFSRIRLLGSR